MAYISSVCFLYVESVLTCRVRLRQYHKKRALNYSVLKSSVANLITGHTDIPLRDFFYWLSQFYHAMEGRWIVLAYFCVSVFFLSEYRPVQKRRMNKQIRAIVATEAKPNKRKQWYTERVLNKERAERLRSAWTRGIFRKLAFEILTLPTLVRTLHPSQ